MCHIENKKLTFNYNKKKPMKISFLFFFVRILIYISTNYLQLAYNKKKDFKLMSNFIIKM